MLTDHTNPERAVLYFTMRAMSSEIPKGAITKVDDAERQLSPGAIFAFRSPTARSLAAGMRP